MKMKSFAMLAMSGMLVASLSYAAPTLVADNTSGADAQNVGAMDQGSTSGSDASQSDSTAGSDANANSGAAPTDGGSPDTATGDDDY